MTIILRRLRDKDGDGDPDGDPVNGFADITFGAMTSSASAYVAAGSANVTFAPMTMSATGGASISGSANVTFGAMTSAAQGYVAAGSANITFDPMYVTAAGNAGGGATLLDSGRIGGQVYSLVDFSADALTSDMMKRTRNFSSPSGANQFAEATKLVSELYNAGENKTAYVKTISRSGTTVTVVLNTAPENEYVIASGQRVCTTVDGCVIALDSLGLEADHATLTRVNDRTFTYQTLTSGTVAAYTTLYADEIPCTIIYGVAVGTDGHPDADYYSLISTVGGSATKNGDLDSTGGHDYTLTLDPGSTVPTITCDGAAMSGSGSTRTVVVDSTDTAFIGFKFVGINPANWKQPTLVRSDHSLSDYLRPDAAEMNGRCRQLRVMDLGRTNLNAFIKSWDTRPKVACGLGMPLEDMVRMANQLNVGVFWYCFPDWVTDDYITKTCEYLRDNLNPGILIKLEKSNEVWNGGTFPHYFWSINRACFRLKAYFHGTGGGAYSNIHNVITSVTRVGTTVTVNMSRPPPFASGTRAFKITQGSTTGYNTPDAGTTVTVSGNSFSFTNGGSASGPASVTKAVMIGEPTDPLYAWDALTDAFVMSDRMHGETTYQMGQIAIPILGARAQIMLCSFEEATFNQEHYVLPWLEDQYGDLDNWLYGIGGAPYPLLVGKAVTVNFGTDVFTSTAHGLANNDVVYLYADTMPNPLSVNVGYFVINKTTDTFQLSLTSGGAAINTTTSGSNVKWTNLVQLQGSLDTLMDAMDVRTTHYKSVAAGRNLKLCAYEFNLAMFGIGNNTTLIDSMHSSPIGRQMQYDLLNRCLIAGYDEMMIFQNSFTFTRSSGGTHWGWLGNLADNKTIGGADDERLKGHDDRLLEPA